MKSFDSAVEVLNKTAEKFGHTFKFYSVILSAVAAIDATVSLCLMKLLKAVLPATAYCWEQ